MTSVGSLRLRDLETSFFNEIQEINARLDKELKPIKEAIDQGIDKIVDVIVEQFGKKNPVPATGFEIIDRGISGVVQIVNKAQIREQLIGLCWTVLRVQCLGAALLVMNNPVYTTLSSLAFFMHAVYRGVLALEDGQEAQLPADKVVNNAVEAFLFQGLVNPMVYAVDRTVEALENAAKDLNSAKQFIITLGHCL